MALKGMSWKYINEGNAHIVLQLLDTRYVIRLLKEGEKPITYEDTKQSVDFVNNVMNPLLFRFQEKSELVTLTTEEFCDLQNNMHQFRPKHRLTKSSFSVNAIRAPNLAIISPQLQSNYCIEIKAKEGFLSPSLKHSGRCYYCLKQYLKLQDKQISNISHYCPLDLFSGQKPRMKKALVCLTQNPQNNFKVFHHYELIYSEKSSIHSFEKCINDMKLFENIDQFYDFIIEILLSEATVKNIIKLSSPSVVTASYESKVCIDDCELPKTSYLYKILRLQKLIKPDFHLACCRTSDIDFVQSCLEFLKVNDLNLEYEADVQKFLAKSNDFNLAMISAIVRDCSLMISFSPDFIDHYSYVEVNGKLIPYKVSATDLEPKHPDSLYRRVANERKLLETYEKSLHSKIQPHAETRIKQLQAWQHLIIEYLKANKQSTIDIRESQNSALFNNTAIDRKLSQEAILIVLEDMAKSGLAAPVDKSKTVWEVYWHSLDEWGNMIYSWASSNGMTNAVCTLFELREGENTVGEEFHGLDMNVLLKALKTLETKGKCELMDFDGNQGVKFF